jgi:uncharacterized Zn finger protein (UPF0148 family)
MSDASARIAARLLRGWTLTAERCPVARCGTPLMRERATDATFYCAGGDASVRLDDVEHGARSGAVDAWEAESDEDEDARDRDGARAREVGTSEEEDGDADDARSPSAREDATGVDGGIDGLVLRDGVVDVSGRVAEKMLMGWTLTNDVCPVSSCSAPLVRNRAGESFCVRHEMFVRKGESATRAMGATVSAPKPPPGTAAARDGKSRVGRQSRVDDEIEESSLRTLRALEEKLAQARGALRDETDVDKCRSWLAFIDELHGSMRALSGGI